MPRKIRKRSYLNQLAKITRLDLNSDFNLVVLIVALVMDKHLNG